jgi:hypothetical protein
MHARSFLTPLRTPRLTWAVLIPLAAGLSGCVQDKKAAPLPGNLLTNAKVVASGVANVERTTDGLLAIEGDFWDTGITARFTDPQGHITWDLGSIKDFEAALVQGDNNDDYILSGSDDGQQFNTLWQSGPVNGPGMRLRQTKSRMVENTRFLRLTATGGDGSYSVGEFAVFAKVPQGWPGIALTRAEGAAPDGGSSGWGVSLGVLAAAIAILIFLSRKRRPPAGEPIPPEAPPSP